MKKNLLMIVVICLLAVPTQANNFTDKLCEDEIFVSLVKESITMSEHLKNLDENARIKFLQSEEMSCLLEEQAGRVIYTHQMLRDLFNNDKGLIIREAINQVLAKVTKNCEAEYSTANLFCYMVFQMEVGEPGSPINQYAYYHLQACLAAAALQYAICSGGVV